MLKPQRGYAVLPFTFTQQTHGTRVELKTHPGHTTPLESMHMQHTDALATLYQ